MNRNEARIYTQGLPGAVYQSFMTYESAIDTYFRLRTLSDVQVIRGPGDTNEEFGAVETAEDI